MQRGYLVYWVRKACQRMNDDGTKQSAYKREF